MFSVEFDVKFDVVIEFDVKLNVEVDVEYDIKINVEFNVECRNSRGQLAERWPYKYAMSLALMMCIFNLAGHSIAAWLHPTRPVP